MSAILFRHFVIADATFSPPQPPWGASRQRAATVDNAIRP
jgi:hypothetical protein